MRNRMQDLDFEQTVAFDSVKDFEFTRKAAQKFRQVVSLDSFEDEDADVIFHYLYKEMELVSFGDYLKRYVYERAELEEPFSQVPQEVYREIVVESFKETYTPKSMSPTSAKLSSLVNNWLTQASVKRETVFLLGFGLRMSTEDVSDFLTRVLREQDFDFHNPEEVIYWYCYRNHLGYYKAEEYKETYKQMTPVEKKTGEIVYGTGLCLDSEEKLLEYLAFLKGRHDDPKSEKMRKKTVAKRSGSLRISVLRIWKRLSAAGSLLIKWEISKRCPHPFWQSISARSASAARGSTIS